MVSTPLHNAVPVPLECESCRNPYLGASYKSDQFVLSCPQCRENKVLEEDRQENGNGDSTVSDVSGD